MKLDYIDSTSSFVLTVARGEADIGQLMKEHGLDFSLPRSTPDKAVLFTKEPYAAVAFTHVATDRAKAVLKGILNEIDSSWMAESGSHYRVPEGKELWPFQKADLDYALRRKHTLIGDQPGLGKTPTAVVFANEIGAKRVLAIVPASIRRQWVERIQEWTTLRLPRTIHTIRSSRDGVNPYANWIVASYEMARTPAIGRALSNLTFDAMILDEAHYLKTIDSLRTRAVFGGGREREFEPLYSRAGAILALTGTPLPNRPREAYTLARGLCFESIDYMSEDAFRFRFNPSMRGEFVDKETGITKVYTDEKTGRHEELQARLRANFMVRHLKRDVLPQLKMPVYDIIRVDETKAVKDALEAESLLDIDPDNFDEHIASFGNVPTVRRMMGEAIAPQVADYVDMLIDGGEEKLVIFAWHISVLDILEKRFRKYGVVRYHAGKHGHNNAAKHEFMENPNVRIIIGNTLTLGTGTDGLQSVCNHALIAEPDWTPGNNVQCFDRLDRGGQTRTVQGEIFVAPGSIMEKVLAKALNKLQVTHKALDRRRVS